MRLEFAEQVVRRLIDAYCLDQDLEGLMIAECSYAEDRFFDDEDVVVHWINFIPIPPERFRRFRLISGLDIGGRGLRPRSRIRLRVSWA